MKNGPFSLIVGAICALLLTTVATLPAAAAEDDIEFARRLAAHGYFDYARRVLRDVLDDVLEDPDRTPEEKAEARYGLALVRKEEAIAATGSTDASYDDIVEMFDWATADLAEFIRRNPGSAHVHQAKLDAGTLRLAFVQWARELLEGDVASLEWGVPNLSSRLEADARRSVNEAMRCFDRLCAGENSECPKRLRDRASYYRVLTLYFQALVEPPCSPVAMSALEQAGEEIEAYIMDHDGELLAVYAQDVYGLVWWERARCTEDPRTRLAYYGRAFTWFETCVHTDDKGPDHLRIITRGYYHLAQAGLDAGRMPRRDFGNEARLLLEKMLDEHPGAWRLHEGLRALLEWSKLECARGDASRAIEVARLAADRAKRADEPRLERAADRLLSDYVTGICGATFCKVGPQVLQHVADDLFSRSRFADAIRAYRTLVAATESTTEDFLAYRWHAWRRMARAYHRLGDRLAEALAYEPIHEAWVHGRIPHDQKSYVDSNMILAGDNRRRAQVAARDLADRTGAEAFKALHRQIERSVLRDYPMHGGPSRSLWTEALRRWKWGLEHRKDDEPDWREHLAKAYEIFVRVSEDAAHSRQDSAWVYRIRTQYVRERFGEVVEEAEAAWTYWNGPEARAHAAKYEAVRNRRRRAQAAAEYWTAASLLKLERYAEAAGRLTGWHDRYPDAPSPYPSFAYDLLIETHIALEDITTADRYFRALLERDPKYPGLPRLTRDLAGHFNEQRREIDAQLIQATNASNEARRAFREADRETGRLSPRRDAAYAKLEASRETVAELRAALYEPLLRSATYWYAWDRSLVATQAERSPQNVLVFAHMFLELARLRPEVSANWERARELYEAYLEMTAAADPPPPEESRRQAHRELGEVLVGLAKLMTDGDERRAEGERAVEVLTEALGADSAARDVVVEMLADRVLVVRWRDADGKTWRVPVPRCRTVEELRRAVADLPPTPTVRALRKWVARMKAEEFERLFLQIRVSFFDPALYEELAETDVSFRLALAQAYAWSDDDADLRRAVNLATSLVTEPLAVEEDTDEWWIARAIQMECLLRIARHRLQSPVPDDDALRWLDRAEKILKGLTESFSHLGRHDPGRWAAIRAELEALRARVNR